MRAPRRVCDAHGPWRRSSSHTPPSAARRWRGDARHFLRRNRSALAALPLWVFSSGPTGDPAKDNAAWSEPGHTIKQAVKLGAREHVFFGGSVPAEPKGAMERSMVDGVPPQWRDRRNWDEIRGWAVRIAAELRSERAAA